MTIRRPAVAEMFYPADRASLTQEIERCLTESETKTKCLGAMAPHAGYVFSGAIAGEVFSQMEIPQIVIILAPNHRGPLVPFALSSADSWRTPLGDAPLEKSLSEAIAENCTLVEFNDAPHAQEHAAEVQVPFLQYLRPDVRIVPVVIAEQRYAVLAEFGQCLVDCIGEQDVLILSSSDMTHFEDARTAKERDNLAIEQILALDPEELHNVVMNNRISMCGISPTVAMLAAAKKRGATKAELVKYGNSGETTGDTENVVAYASVKVY